jgi:hypothetical protein
MPVRRILNVPRKNEWGHMYKGEQIKQIVIFPAEVILKTARIPMKLGRFGLIVLGVSHQPHIAERLQTDAPLHKAKLGVEAIKQGREIEQEDALSGEELVKVGEALVVAAWADADHDSRVPDNITHQVVEIAHNIHLNPLENPLISTTLAQEAVRELGDRPAAESL